MKPKSGPAKTDPPIVAATTVAFDSATDSVCVNTAPVPETTAVTRTGLHTSAMTECRPNPTALTPVAAEKAAAEETAAGSAHASSAAQRVSSPTQLSAPCSSPSLLPPSETATTVSFWVEKETACISNVPLPHKTSSQIQNRNVVRFSFASVSDANSAVGSFTQRARVGSPPGPSASLPPIVAAVI